MNMYAFNFNINVFDFWKILKKKPKYIMGDWGNTLTHIYIASALNSCPIFVSIFSKRNVSFEFYEIQTISRIEFYKVGRSTLMSQLLSDFVTKFSRWEFKRCEQSFSPIYIEFLDQWLQCYLRRLSALINCETRT